MDLQAKYRQISDKCSDLNAQLQAALVDDSFNEKDFKVIKDELHNAKVQRNALREQLAEDDNDNGAEPQPVLNKKGKDLTPKKSNLEKQKTAINDFVHSRGRKISDDAATAVTSTVVEPLVPETIIYDPTAEVNTVVDLSTLVTKLPVTTKKGTYPILKRADDSLASTEELKANPELAAPEFDEVDWSVSTYRGALPISEESIDDAEVDLTSLIGHAIGEKKVNTVNKAIAPVLQAFTAVSAESSDLVDTIKHILNVDLDTGYARTIVASQSMYQVLDTLKDKNGQYLLHQSITEPSGGVLLGVTVKVVNDSLLGEDGEAKAFIGDLKRAVLFPDRKEISLSWIDNPTYGQYLGAVMRFGAQQADSKAGYFLTVSDVEATTTTTTAASTTTASTNTTTTTTAA